MEIHPTAKIIKDSYHNYEIGTTEIIFVSSNIILKGTVYQKKRCREVRIKDYYSFPEWIFSQNGENDYML
jgi:hypothetical protein